jgi:hypothetical protein
VNSLSGLTNPLLYNLVPNLETRNQWPQFDHLSESSRRIIDFCGRTTLRLFQTIQSQNSSSSQDGPTCSTESKVQFCFNFNKHCCFSAQKKPKPAKEELDLDYTSCPVPLVECSNKGKILYSHSNPTTLFRWYLRSRRCDDLLEPRLYMEQETLT